MRGWGRASGALARTVVRTFRSIEAAAAPAKGCPPLSDVLGGGHCEVVVGRAPIDFHHAAAEPLPPVSLRLSRCCAARRNESASPPPAAALDFWGVMGVGRRFFDPQRPSRRSATTEADWPRGRPSEEFYALNPRWGRGWVEQRAWWMRGAGGGGPAEGEGGGRARALSSRPQAASGRGASERKPPPPDARVRMGSRPGFIQAGAKGAFLARLRGLCPELLRAGSRRLGRQILA